MRRRPSLQLLVLIVSGCAASGRTFEYDDKVAVRSAFLDVVKEYYRQRQDGVLQAPTVDPDRVRVSFLYDKEVNGAESEVIDITFKRAPPPSSRVEVGGGSYRPVYSVLVYQPVRGPNRVMKDETKRVENMLQDRLKSVPH